MKKFKASVINRILNFRRYVDVVAPDFRNAIILAKRAFPGYDEVEWCRAVSIA